MITYYIEDMVFNRAATSPFINKVKRSYSNKEKKTVLLVSSGIPTNFVDFFEDNGINLSGEYSANDSIFLTNKLTDIKEKDSRDIFIIDEKAEITSISLMKLRKKFNVHYLTLRATGGSRMLNHVAKNDMLIAKESCFLDSHFCLAIVSIYPEYLEQIKNLSLRPANYYGGNNFLLISEAKTIKVLDAETNTIEEFVIENAFENNVAITKPEEYLTEITAVNTRLDNIEKMLMEIEDDDPLRHFRGE